MNIGSRALAWTHQPSYQLWLQNRQNLSALTTILSRSASFLSALYVRAFGQSLENAKLNVVRQHGAHVSHMSLTSM